ncbi:MAG: hypothetical protein AAB646_01065 [Patescibacteria group bacterium]
MSEFWNTFGRLAAKLAGLTSDLLKPVFIFFGNAIRLIIKSFAALFKSLVDLL